MVRVPGHSGDRGPGNHRAGCQRSGDIQFCQRGGRRENDHYGKFLPPFCIPMPPGERPTICPSGPSVSCWGWRLGMIPPQKPFCWATPMPKVGTRNRIGSGLQTAPLLRISASGRLHRIPTRRHGALPGCRMAGDCRNLPAAPVGPRIATAETAG